MKPIQVFEHEKLTTHKDFRGRSLTVSQLNKLYDFNDKNDNVYFTPIRDGIKFNNYVGVIQIGGLTIEILPKADKELVKDESDYQKWQKVLLRMLSICRYLSIETVSETYLEKRHNSILELYFEIYLLEVCSLIRKGLIKKYRQNSGNLYTLKGKINYSKNIQQNLVHQERFYTEHQIYDHEHLINQILLRALVLLGKMVVSPHLLDQINRVMIDFPEIKEIEINYSHFKNLKETRKSLHYNKALQIARMIILNYSPDIRGGNENMIALLFDMNKLWERYIYEMLIKADEKSLKIEAQSTKHFWESKTIRPDIVITKTNETGKTEKLIIDTKWKIVDAKSPADDDLKQMFAYNVYWEANKSMLLYPKSFEQEEKFGTFHKGINGSSKCKLGFINILNEKRELDMMIGNKILYKLFNDCND